MDLLDTLDLPQVEILGGRTVTARPNPGETVLEWLVTDCEQSHNRWSAREMAGKVPLSCPPINCSLVGDPDSAHSLRVV